MQVLVHGGAGGAPREPHERQSVLDEAASAGVAATTPTDAVVEAVRVLEGSTRFNAGRGGTIQTDGTVRTDAGIMTSDGRVGGVCSVPGIVHPVELARYVKDETPHVLLGPDGALPLADHLGIETNADLRSGRARERFDEIDVPTTFAEQLEFVTDRFGRPADDLDTVGAVATDGEHLAAATSTGGRWLALAGRIGDVPQIGSGFYCSDRCAVSTTGAGEAIARVTLARTVDRLVADGASVQQAAIEAIAELEAVTGDRAGLIAMDAAGTIGTAFNSTRMQTAYASAET